MSQGSSPWQAADADDRTHARCWSQQPMHPSTDFVVEADSHPDRCDIDNVFLAAVTDFGASARAIDSMVFGTAAALADPSGDEVGGEVIFNSPEWGRIVCDCYGFDDRTIKVGDTSLPLFLTSSPLFGRKLVSAVYNTYASPVYSTPNELEALLRGAITAAEDDDVEYLQIKSFQTLAPEVVERLGFTTRRPYKLTTVALAPYAELSARWSGRFRRDLRSWSRRLAAAGVVIQRSTERRDWEAFYHLLARRYRDRHRMIAQPFELFELIRERLAATRRADLWVARGPRGIAAGAVFGLHAGVATGLFSAADEAYAAVSVDTLLKHEALRHYGDLGMRLCDFGITSPKQPGVLFAKGRFCGSTRDLPSYYYPVRAGWIPEIDYADAFLWLRRPFRFLPLPLVEAISSRLVRYLN